MTTLMVQGTTSDAGKTTVVAALCRWLARQGISVAPFKPQNMALNSAPTCDGGEIARSTALQALACEIEPHSDMNPVLLKPHTDCGAEVLIRGRHYAQLNAVDYHAYKAHAMQSVMAAWQALSERYQVIIAEGAGSPAEINLRQHDIANMGFAEAADCPVLLVGDIDRGGVLAQLVGTLALLSPSEQARTQGLLINRFRGDLALLQPGLDWLSQHTHKPVIGVLPYLTNLLLDAEDGLASSQHSAKATFKVLIPLVPRMTQHNEFDPLRLHPALDVCFSHNPAEIPAADLIILPGSQNPIATLAWLKQHGWLTAIQRHLRYGGKLLALGSSFPLLGQSLSYGATSQPQTELGLGLVALHTQLARITSLESVQGNLCLPLHAGLACNGYRLVQGSLQGSALDTPLLQLNGQAEGVLSLDQQVAGCAVHGLFEQPQVAEALLDWAGLSQPGAAVDYQQHRLKELDRLADLIDQHLDTQWLYQVLKLNPTPQGLLHV
ncbi:cobyric acid synthase [Thiopseudomonas alkaliphila]|uniref:cobyric acid synthase n=1 Tax=Thiopseudomonas alkaliphila TaxID=1697053 RepID=UPI00069F58C9|nr:cobyric acid synthase [Thiopseudomonas alkaliphila]AKX46641.1 cobyric acid synthase [Thiopseudomonas alkaliphila]